MFENFASGLMTTEEKTKATMLAISTVVQDAFNVMSEASQRRFDAEYKRLEDEKDIALGFAGDSAAAKAEIEKDYEQKRKAIAKREFKAKREQAIFNIAIDTAQAVMAMAGKGSWWMVPAVIALGAVQAGIVASQKVPEYWKGTDSAEGGLAWTQERGQEIITDKYGNVKDLGDSQGARLTKLDKGDKVHTASRTRDMLSFSDNLSAILMRNDINPTPSVIVDNSELVSEMRSLKKSIEDKPTSVVNIDKKGIHGYLLSRGNKVEELNNRVSLKGQNV
jgi:hypothetical protein